MSPEGFNISVRWYFPYLINTVGQAESLQFEVVTLQSIYHYQSQWESFLPGSLEDWRVCCFSPWRGECWMRESPGRRGTRRARTGTWTWSPRGLLGSDPGSQWWGWSPAPRRAGPSSSQAARSRPWWRWRCRSSWQVQELLDCEGAGAVTRRLTGWQLSHLCRVLPPSRPLQNWSCGPAELFIWTRAILQIIPLSLSLSLSSSPPPSRGRLSLATVRRKSLAGHSHWL